MPYLTEVITDKSITAEMLSQIAQLHYIEMIISVRDFMILYNTKTVIFLGTKLSGANQDFQNTEGAALQLTIEYIC